MAAMVCLNVCIADEEKSTDLVFFSSRDWNEQTEKQLLAKIQEMLTVSRSLVSAMDLIVKVQTKNPELLLFSLSGLEFKKTESKPANLTIREMEVLALIMQGLTNHDIADKLFISFETVKSHRKNILEKTGAKNTAALIHHYHQTFFDKE